MYGQVKSLPEYADLCHIEHVFGAYAAHQQLTSLEIQVLIEMAAVRVVFHRLLIVDQGRAEVICDGAPVIVQASQLLILPPSCTVAVRQTSGDFRGELLCVDDNLGATACLDLTGDDVEELKDICHMIVEIISHNHIYNTEMVRSMVNVLRLFLSELPYKGHENTRDLRHKKDIYETFVYLAKRNFRTQRQLRFYADKLNMTTTYLSRTVKEMSGVTVNEYLTSMVYNEICNVLKNTDLSMGEIALRLHFNDQSALSNFFKSRAGMSPLAYRNS